MHDDGRIALDRAGPGTVYLVTRQRVAVAFDRGSARSYDAEGRLHVHTTNISKANVCPYIGREIPNSEALGLDPDKVYRLLRHPDELRAAAPSFNRLPVLSKHVAVSADDHQPDLVVGATGSDAEFDDPFLRNSLVIWSKDAIDNVEDESKKELSCAYRYRADMTPGEYFGEPYDGVMRDIIGNHVALVKEGRAGTDVVVGDEKQQEKAPMPKIATTVKAVQAHGAIVAYLAPRIAKDAKLDLSPVISELGKVTVAGGLKAAKDAIMTSVRDATKGHLAKDASVDGLAQVIDMLDAHGLGGGSTDADPPEQPTIEGGMKREDPNPHLEASQHESPFESEDEEEGELPAFLKKHMSEDAYKAAMDMLHGRAKDNDPKLKELGAARDKEPKGAPGGAKNMAGDSVSKTAMDAAIAEAVKGERANQKTVREAEQFVRPWIGEMAMAHDSAEEVYRTALGAIGIDAKALEGCPAHALRAVLQSHPKPGQAQRQRQTTTIAADAAGVPSFDKLYPEASRIGTL